MPSSRVSQSADLAVPRVGRIRSRSMPDRRRLAGAVRSQEAEDLAGLDAQVQTLDADDLPVALGQVRGLDRREGHPRGWAADLRVWKPSGSDPTALGRTSTGHDEPATSCRVVLPRIVRRSGPYPREPVSMRSYSELASASSTPASPISTRPFDGRVSGIRPSPVSSSRRFSRRSASSSSPAVKTLQVVE